MAKSTLRNSTELLLDTIFNAMHEKKAEQILLLDLTEIKGASFDYFVIAHGNSTTQVDAIAEEIRRQVKTVCHQNPAHAEGFTNAEWILLDYHSIIVHVFQKEVREHYQLENLWADAIITPIEEEVPAPKKTKTEPQKSTDKPQKSTDKPVKKTPKKTTQKDETIRKSNARKSTTRSSGKTELQSKRKSATQSKSTSKPKSTRTTKTSKTQK